MNYGMNILGIDPDTINPRCKYSQKDAARLLKKSVMTLYRWDKAGKFSPRSDKKLKRYVYHGSDLRALVAE